MPIAHKTTWTGASGEKYTYAIFPLPPELNSVPGNYIFAKQEDKRWVPLYIGQTDDLSESFEKLPVMPRIRLHGATHIHAHINYDEAARVAEELDLVSKYAPPCNS